MKRLLLIEHKEILAEGLRSTLSSQYEIVGVVNDAAQVLAIIEQHRPDVILLDSTMRVQPGTILSGISQQHSGQLVLFTLRGPEHAASGDGFPYEILGLVPRDVSVAELRQAIMTVLGGGSYLSSALERSSFHDESDSPVRLGLLSPRQREVVRLIGHELTSAQIADAIGISIWTVHFHRKTIRRRLGLRNDRQLYKYALLQSQSTAPDKIG